MFEFKTKPMDHQKKALGKSRGQEAFAYLMEMGTGKTKVMIDEAAILFDRGEIDTMMVFAPKGVYIGWYKELQIHMAVPYSVSHWVAGGGNKKHQLELSDLCRPDRSVLRVLLVNIEAMSTAGVAEKYVERFLASGRCYGAIDESTKIKNPGANRTKRMVRMGARMSRRRIATGSPVTRSPLDLFSQFEFLKPGLLGFRSWFNFRARFAVMQEKRFGGRKVNIVVGYRNMGELTEKLQEHSYRVLKEECLDLPPKTYMFREVELTDQQATLYASMRDQAFAEFGDNFVSSQQAITTLLRLHQIVCGHITDDDGRIISLASNRVNELMEWAEEVRADGIIWARYQHDIDKISEAIKTNYGEASLAQFHGRNSATRQDDVRRFLDDDRCRWMLSTQQSGGYGNTWLNGIDTAYFSNSFDLELRMQSEDRPHRSGQTQHCTYTDLVARGTIDERLIGALRNKLNIAEAILGDSPRNWLI